MTQQLLPTVTPQQKVWTRSALALLVLAQLVSQGLARLTSSQTSFQLSLFLLEPVARFQLRPRERACLEFP
jgi:hypothetical protein